MREGQKQAADAAKASKTLALVTFVLRVNDGSSATAEVGVVSKLAAFHRGDLLEVGGEEGSGGGLSRAAPARSMPPMTVARAPTARAFFSQSTP